MMRGNTNSQKRACFVVKTLRADDSQLRWDRLQKVHAVEDVFHEISLLR